MRATLNAWGASSDIVFTPHLLPVTRGILSTITIELAPGAKDPAVIWRAAFGNEPFLELASEPPALREVAHRNVVRVFFAPVAGTKRPTFQVFSAIDNLMKGAAGQAVQNANVMLGIAETEGLPS
jgi:N-acetyl-gamma-glutamyl-phosphate reductase